MRATPLILILLLLGFDVANATSPDSSDSPRSPLSPRRRETQARMFAKAQGVESAPVARNTSTLTITRCLSALRHLGENPFRELSYDDRHYRDALITDLQILHRASKDELAEIVLDKLSKNESLVPRADSRSPYAASTLQVLGHLALDPSISFKHWRLIAEKFISQLKQDGVEGDFETRTIAANALRAMLDTRGQDEIDFFQNYYFVHWDEVIHRLRTEEASIVIPGLALVFSKKGLTRDQTNSIIGRLHAYRQGELADELADLTLRDKSTLATHRLASAVESSLDLLQPEADTTKFYKEFQSAYTDAEELDAKRQPTAMNFQSADEEGDYAEVLIDEYIDNAKEAYLLRHHAKNDQERFAAIRLAKARTHRLGQILKMLEGIEDSYAQKKGDASVPPVSLRRAREAIERVLHNDLVEIVLYGDLKSFDDFVFRARSIATVRKSGRLLSEIPLTELKQIGEMEGNAFTERLLRQIPDSIERNYLMAPRADESFQWIKTMISQESSEADREKAFQSLRSYLDDLDHSVDLVLSEFHVHDRSQIDADRSELERRFRLSRRLIAYANIARTMMSVVQVAKSGVGKGATAQQTDFFDRLLNRLARTRARVAEAPLYNYAVTLPIFLERDQIINRYRLLIPSDDALFKQRLAEDFERIGNLSDDIEFERELKKLVPNSRSATPGTKAQPMAKKDEKPPESAN